MYEIHHFDNLSSPDDLDFNLLGGQIYLFIKIKW